MILRFLSNRMLWGCVLVIIPSGLFAADGAALMDQRGLLSQGPVHDGVTYIDQNRVQAGGVTSGDAPGFPVTISQPGSYRLSGNLTLPDRDTTAIVVTADLVTIDLNGFSIIGPVVCTPNPTRCELPGSGIGVQAGEVGGNPGPSGVRVLNGTIRGTGYDGVLITGAGGMVQGVTVDNSGGSFGILVNGRAIDSVARLIRGTGIAGGIVRGCTAEENGFGGIVFGQIAAGNTASSNGGTGISGQGVVEGNVAAQNGLFGFDIKCPSSVTGNTGLSNASGPMNTTDASCALANNAPHP